MTRMQYPRFPASGAAFVASWLAAGCISDHEIEADVPASAGIVQPKGSDGAKLTAAEACERITSARAAAAKTLGCDDPGDECPKYLFVAGSIPCDEYAGASVDACVSVIESYDTCKDFSEKACVATPVAGSCRTPAVPDGGGGHRDSGLTKDAGKNHDGSVDAGSPDR